MITYRLAHDLAILFVGINPHPGSYTRGVPFANTKLFWYHLADAGLLQEQRSELQDPTFLHQLYTSRFTQVYRYAIIDIASRPSRTAQDLSLRERHIGGQEVQKAILHYQPRLVCFVGKFPYKVYNQLSTCTYGWQDTLGNSQIYVMHTPSRGPAIVRIQELQEIARALDLPLYNIVGSSKNLHRTLMSLQLKRVYEPSSIHDGFRILVDRLWPRGLSQEKANIDIWLKDIAPSTELRKWFAHDPARWTEFRKRYAQELKAHQDAVTLLKHLIRAKKNVTLLYAAHDEEHNNAVALQRILKLHD